MDKRFVPLNALIAFCSSATTSWPRPFFDAGYRLQALEFPAPTITGRVVADVVAWSPSDARFVLGEAKSGANVDEEQARRYSSVQTTTLVQMLGVSIAHPVSLRTQVVYAVLAEHLDRVVLGLGQAGVSYPVLVIGEDTVQHIGAPLEHPVLATRFARPLRVPGPPPGIITFDADSPDDDFDRAVSASLVAALARHAPAVSIPNLAEDALPYLAMYPDGYRSRLVRKVEASARRAAAAAPETFAYQPSSGTNASASIRVLNSPEDLDPRGRTQRYQALAGRFSPKGRRRPVPRDRNQLSFFGQDTFERELSDLAAIDDDGRDEGDDGQK